MNCTVQIKNVDGTTGDFLTKAGNLTARFDSRRNFFADEYEAEYAIKKYNRATNKGQSFYIFLNHTDLSERTKTYPDYPHCYDCKGECICEYCHGRDKGLH